MRDLCGLFGIGIMKNTLNFLKISLILAALGAVVLSIPLVIYLKVLPSAVSDKKVIAFVEKNIKESAGVDVKIKNPALITGLNSDIVFKFDEINITKDKEEYLNLKNFETSVSFKEIFKKKIILNKLGLDYIFADVNSLMTLGSGQPQAAPTKSDWEFYWFDSLMYIKESLIVYDIDKHSSVKVSAKNLEITDTKNPKYAHFDINADLKKGSHTLKFALKDNDNVYIKNRKLIIDKADLKINKSKVFISSVSDEKNNFDVTVFSNGFDVKNVVELLNTNMVVPNGAEMLAFYKDIDGNFDFKINLKNNDLKGDIKINKASLKVIPVNNLPLTVEKGLVTLDSKNIYLKDFQGYYGKNRRNHVEFFGEVKDYTKSVDTKIEASGLATDELTRDYLSKVAGCKLTLTGGDSGTKLLISSIYNKIDITWLFKLAKGKDILIEGASLSPVNFDRALKADFHFEDNIFQIKTINYYIAEVIDKNSKGKIKPILTINGNVDCSTPIPVVKDLGFEIPKPLPSEFLNVLIGQKVFKKGTIAGNMRYINTGKVPQLDGNMKMLGVRIPSQRLGIKEGSFTADKNLLHINAKGRFKRSEYDFSGNIKNSLLLPVVIKNINLTVDNIDVDRIINSMNQQNTATASTSQPNQETVQALGASTFVTAQNDDENDDTYTFDTGLIIVEECVLQVVKGFYKDIKFGNLKANLTLDDKGILEIKSNRFDFAEGISSLKVFCDLKKHNYSLRLGVKDINSDLIATTLLALKREITGKASGLIEINTDDSLKLNGRIQFIVKDGAIAKVGLVEYALKFASLFRNPMAMISPSTIVDLVNVPEGSFEKIVGDLHMKDNVVEKIMIKSSASQLSSFIIGRFDLETRDASLRIYTKFSNKNKGLAGFLRNISLNSLANRVPLNSRNDSLYYSAELEQLPPIDADEKDCQVFLTKVDGDVETFNFLSSLKKIK